MSKKKSDKTDNPKPKKVKKTKPEYIHDGNVKCPNCEEYETEIQNSNLICKYCGQIISGIAISVIIGLFIYVSL